MVHIENCLFFSTTDAFLRKIISVCIWEGKSSAKKIACQNTPLAANTLIKPTSPLSRPASAFLLPNRAIRLPYLPSLSHSSSFAQSDYTLPFQLMPGFSRGAGGGRGLRGPDFVSEYVLKTRARRRDNRPRCQKTPRSISSLAGEESHLDRLQVPPGPSLRGAPAPRLLMVLGAFRKYKVEGG